MSFLRPKTSFLLPLLSGIGLLWALPQWKPLAQIEHALFLFPERFEPDRIFPQRGQLSDFQVTPLSFANADQKAHPPHTPSPSTYLIDEKTRDIIDLSPEKWAYFLQTIRTPNPNQELLVITAPLSWPDASALSLETLDHQIAQLPHLVIGLDAEFNNTSAPLPPFLESSAIASPAPSHLDLPRIDFLTLPPSIQAPLFGISTVQGLIIETSPSTIKVPLMIRWDEAILPSTHLAALIASQKIKPSEVIIEPTGYLRLGSKGPIIKIDPQGRATFPKLGNAALSAAQLLIYPERTPASKIIHPAQPPQFLSLLQSHLSQALAQHPSPLKSYQRWSLQIEIAALALFTLLLQAHRLQLPLIIIGLATIFATSLHLHHWFPTTPILLILTTFIIIPKRPPKSPKKAPPAEEEEIEEKKKEEEPKTESPQKKVVKKAPRKPARHKKSKRR